MLQLIWMTKPPQRQMQKYANKANTGTYSDDDVGHVAFLGEDLQATHSLLVANHILQLGWSVLLHPASNDNYIYIDIYVHILTGFALTSNFQYFTSSDQHVIYIYIYIYIYIPFSQTYRVLFWIIVICITYDTWQILKKTKITATQWECIWLVCIWCVCMCACVRVCVWSRWGREMAVR